MGRNISSTLCVIIMLLCFACASSFTYGQSVGANQTSKPQAANSSTKDRALENEMRKEIDVRKSQNMKLMEENKLLRMDIDNLKQQLAKQKKERIASKHEQKGGSSDLQAKVEALTSENAKLRKELQVIRQTRVALAKENEMLNEKVKTYEQTLNQIRGLAK